MPSGAWPPTLSSRTSRGAQCTTPLPRSDPRPLARSFEKTRALILPLLDTLLNDEEYPLRQVLAEQLGGVAEVCVRSGGAAGYTALLETVLPATAVLLADGVPEVRMAAGEALVAAAGLVRPEDLGARVLTLVLGLAHDDEQEELRMAAAVLLNELAQTLGPDLCLQFVASEVICLAEDPVFKVRKAAALNLDAICRVLGPSTARSRILPAFLTLARDEIWGVRKACAEALVSLSHCLEPAVRVTELAPLWERFAADASKWVRNAAYTHLGPFLATLPGARVTAPLLSHFVRMAGVGGGGASAAAPTFAGLDASSAAELPAYAAFSFPAVAITLGRARWQELRPTYLALSRDSSPRVRRPLACALPELARIVGPAAAEADLLPAFRTALTDTDFDVRDGALRAFAGFVGALDSAAREAALPLLDEVLAEVWPLDWRSRVALAAQAAPLVMTLSPAAAYTVLAPWTARLLGDPVAAVRDTAARGFAAVLQRVVASDEGALAAQLVARIVTRHALARAARDRLLFITICGYTMATAAGDVDSVGSSSKASNAGAAVGATISHSDALATEGTGAIVRGATPAAGAGPAVAVPVGLKRPLVSADAAPAAPSSSSPAADSPLAALVRDALLPPLLSLVLDPVPDVRAALARLLFPLSTVAADLAQAAAAAHAATTSADARSSGAHDIDGQDAPMVATGDHGEACLNCAAGDGNDRLTGTTGDSGVSPAATTMAAVTGQDEGTAACPSRRDEQQLCAAALVPSHLSDTRQLAGDNLPLPPLVDTNTDHAAAAAVAPRKRSISVALPASAGDAAETEAIPPHALSKDSVVAMAEVASSLDVVGVGNDASTCAADPSAGTPPQLRDNVRRVSAAAGLATSLLAAPGTEAAISAPVVSATAVSAAEPPPQPPVSSDPLPVSSREVQASMDDASSASVAPAFSLQHFVGDGTLLPLSPAAQIQLASEPATGVSTAGASRDSLDATPGPLQVPCWARPAATDVDTPAAAAAAPLAGGASSAQAAQHVAPLSQSSDPVPPGVPSIPRTWISPPLVVALTQLACDPIPAIPSLLAPSWVRIVGGGLPPTEDDDGAQHGRSYITPVRPRDSLPLLPAQPSNAVGANDAAWNYQQRPLPPAGTAAANERSGGGGAAATLSRSPFSDGPASATSATPDVATSASNGIVHDEQERDSDADPLYPPPTVEEDDDGDFGHSSVGAIMVEGAATAGTADESESHAVVGGVGHLFFEDNHMDDTVGVHQEIQVQMTRRRRRVAALPPAMTSAAAAETSALATSAQWWPATESGNTPGRTNDIAGSRMRNSVAPAAPPITMRSSSFNVDWTNDWPNGDTTVQHAQVAASNAQASMQQPLVDDGGLGGSNNFDSKITLAAVALDSDESNDGLDDESFAELGDLDVRLSRGEE